MKRIIVGISGATGPVLGLAVLEALKDTGEYETHLVISDGALKTWELECDIPISRLYDAADEIHDSHNLAASISSGSFETEGMIIAPCSMKTLAGIASGYTDNLLVRAADVCLKERRKVVLLTREMPLNHIQIRNMLEATDAGCVVLPPVLTFYNDANTVDKQIEHVVGKVLSQFSIDFSKFKPWEGVDENLL